MWTSEHVLMRFLEAAIVDNLLPPVSGPKPPRTAKLEILRDTDFDANSQEGTRDKSRWSGFNRTAPSGWAITRQEQALEWSLKIHPRLAQALWLFCFARVAGKPAKKFWRRAEITNRSGYRWLGQAIRDVTKQLNEKGEFLVEADLDLLAQFGLIPRHPASRSPSASANFYRADKPRDLTPDTLTGIAPNAPRVGLLDIMPTRSGKRRVKKPRQNDAGASVPTKFKPNRDHPFR